MPARITRPRRTRAGAKCALRCESCAQNGWNLLSKGSTVTCSWYFFSLIPSKWLTQKQKRRTVWRREACPLLCPRRVAGWARGPGGRASHWGSAVCLLAGWKNDNTLLPHSAESLWKLTKGYNATMAVHHNPAIFRIQGWWCVYATNNKVPSVNANIIKPLYMYMYTYTTNYCYNLSSFHP